jgi:cbb3-type cytochrome oxidase subunit 3
MNLETLKSAKNAYLSKSFNLNVRQIAGLIAGAAFVLVITFCLVAALAFWFGTIKGHEWADSSYLQQSEQRLKEATEAETRAKAHIDRANEIALENEEQKADLEIRAETRRGQDEFLIENRKQVDKTAAQNSQKIEKEKVKRDEQIKKDGDDFDLQLDGLCGELARSGQTLSICPGSANNPPDNR